MRNVANYQAMVNKLGIALASSQMAVYPIDVRGLITNQSDASIRAGESFRDISWLWSTHDTMRELGEPDWRRGFLTIPMGSAKPCRAPLIMGRTTIHGLCAANRQWKGKYSS